ncbi:MAG: hypothetical protein K2X80_05955 [Pseudomonadaceae bacterium]|nr:hypothetical protein [Pseudomonadaceae bacterium]
MSMQSSATARHIDALCAKELPVKHDYRQDLQCWFGLSYSSFAVLPRVLMEAMPDEWQKRMAALLHEYSESFPNQPDIGTRVQATKGGRLTTFPEWVLNYRNPDRGAIDRLRDHFSAPATGARRQSR